MHRIFTWATILCIATGCNLSSLEDTVVVSDVADEFYLDIWESLTAQGRFLEFRLRTIADEPCLNATIDCDFQQTNRDLSISIKEIVREEGCEEGEAPATANIRVNSSLPGGYYPFFVDLREKVTTEGQLVITSGAYNISLDEGGGIVLLRPELLRIPDGTIWGYIAYENDGLEAAADEFISSLRSITKGRTLREGYFGYFTVSSEGILKFSNTVAPPGALTFSYEYDGDTETLVNLLEEYRTAYGPGLQIKLWNTLGEEF